MPRRISLAKVRASLQRLGLKDLKQLYIWLGQLIQEREEDIQLPEQPNVLDTRHIAQSCYRLELVKCGNPKCKCASGSLHGPYWYEYWRAGVKVKKKYHGKQIKDSKRPNPPC